MLERIAQGSNNNHNNMFLVEDSHQEPLLPRKDSHNHSPSLVHRHPHHANNHQDSQQQQQQQQHVICRVKSDDSTRSLCSSTASATDSSNTSSFGTCSATSSHASSRGSTTPAYYKLDVAKLPDALWQDHIPVQAWLDHCDVADDRGFPPHSFTAIFPLTWDVALERLVGFPLYQFMNVFPFLVGPLSCLYFACASVWAHALVYFVVSYVGVLCLMTACLEPVFLHKYQQSRFMLASMQDVKRNQYVYTERNTTKYLSVKFVWPRALQRPALQNTSAIFCIVPHGVISWGIAAYPLWSKVWNDRVCRWCIAPIVLKIPGTFQESAENYNYGRMFGLALFV